MALWVGLGSGIGGVGRVLLSGLMLEWFGTDFPYGVLTVNILGSFAIGFVAALTAPEGRVFWSSAARQFFLAGVCGGFTTFSLFSLQTILLLRSGEWLGAAVYAAGTLLFSLLAVALGHIAGQKFRT